MPTTNYSINAVKVIDAALRVLGVLRSGDTTNNDTTMQNDCLEALNLMLKNYQNYGIEQWTRETHTISNLAAYQSNYMFANANADITNIVPERIIQAYITPQANVDVEVTPISMQEYWALANKKATGMPNQVAYNFQNDYGMLYLWPIPTVNTYHLTIVYQKPYDDLDAATDTFDVPQRWFEALKWNLAVRLAPEFGKAVTPEIAALAKSTLDNAIDAGYEDASLFFAPSFRR